MLICTSLCCFDVIGDATLNTPQRERPSQMNAQLNLLIYLFIYLFIYDGCCLFILL